MQTLPPPNEVEQYLMTLFRELERLWPTKSYDASHGMLGEKETQGLVPIFNVGDVHFMCPVKPGDLSDDPVATAARLVAYGKAELQGPNGNDPKRHL